VLDNARYLQRGLHERGFNVVQPTSLPDGSDLLTPIVPVTIGDDWQAVLFWKALYDEGVYANVALYPAVPRGAALLRTSVMATHEHAHLDRALAAFERVREQLAEVEDTSAPATS
jgi:8-amino-7-oxononanoate synthase